MRWLASDFDLADALTKKRAECRVGLLKFLRTGRWCIKYDPQFVSAKKNKKAGRSAISQVDEALGQALEQLTIFGGGAIGDFQSGSSAHVLYQTLLRDIAAL